MKFDDATKAQIAAARPDTSTWLGANAGSGKTRVLTDRVARLLLGGVNPQHVLCLTYTKAAASEMQNRLFKRLGSWAMLEDTSLRNALQELGVEEELHSDRLRQARRLFAQAIETPGGLKIQTIHSFCAAILRRFPLEAGVSPQFTEIEDRAADLLRADIVDDMARSDDAPLVADLARFYTGEDFGSLTRSIVGKQEGFEKPVEISEILSLLGQPANLSTGLIERAVFCGDEAALLERIIPLLKLNGKEDPKAASILEAIPVLDHRALAVLEGVFLYKTGERAFTARLDRFPSKAGKQAIKHDLDSLQAFMLRVEDGRDARLSLLAAEKAVALHRFARAFLFRYAQEKQLRGWLDFDDLILKTRALLRDRTVADWVLYRIDGGMDHILVDEAQDTAPAQWDVVDALAGEFHSGKGSRQSIDRTLFVVGDKKQSIYSFQGADPLEFDRKSAHFGQKIVDAGHRFQSRTLEYSFRSSSAILRFVDTVFDPRRRPGFDKATQHTAFKDRLPGRVDLWPLIKKAESEVDPHWTDPLDRRSEQHHTVRLAEKIACQIKALTNPDDPAFIPDDDPKHGRLISRPVRAGDFLILVQRRSALFSEIIRACKAAGLPIAGADRLKVGAELAVKDLAALLSFLASADDSLSLATALKSPLFGWDEQTLFALAHHRTEPHLWQALRNRADQYSETYRVLRDLRDQLDFLRPYDLIERILTRHDGRRKLLARLGPEAEDGINALLSQALAFERNTVPSLTGFIEWMQTDDVEIKRQIDSASNQIRVMTVHGAKGLEAPIVILPDCGKRDVKVRDEIIPMDGAQVWKPPADEMPHPVSKSVDRMKEAERAERLRLLYVAMTRAEKWLIIAASGELSKDGSDWYQIAQEAMTHLNPVKLNETEILRYQEGDWDALKRTVPAKQQKTPPDLDPVLSEAAPIFSHPSVVLSPSDLGGPKALPGDLGEDTETAMAYGSLVHLLLERLPSLPASDRAKAARHLTASAEAEIADRAISEALGILDSAELAPLFGPDSLAEVAVTGAVGGNRLHGIIDRLVITDDIVQLIDYKTNRHVPDTPDRCPEGILRQMGAYAAVLSQIYPQHDIQTAILWTAAATLMSLPHETVTSALWRSPYLDAGGVRS